MALPRPLLLTLLLMGLSVLGMVAGLLLAQQRLRAHQLAEQQNPRPTTPHFRLHGCDGHEVTSASYAGRVVLLYFGYTYCPDVCPTEMGFLARVLHELGPADAAQVVPLFVSVDPDRDTPDQLAGYVKLFDPCIQALTGTPTQLVAAAAAFGAAFDRYTPAHAAANGYLINHTSATYLIDRSGQLVGSFDHFDQSAKAVEMVRACLRP